jgi:K+-transporting ATPase A subunit
VDGRADHPRSCPRPVEWTLYRAFRIDPSHRQDWMRYALGLLAFNGVAFVCLYAWLRLQGAGNLLFLGLLTAVALVFIAVRLTPALVHAGPASPSRPPSSPVHTG